MTAIPKIIHQIWNSTVFIDRHYYAVINYDSKIYKCTAHMNRTAGVLQDDGVIKWNDNVLSALYAKATFENERCLNCKHLPLCLGPCIQQMKTGKCMMDNSEISYEQFIINIYNKKNSKKWN
jgi:uncharacterized protein